ncbi:MAG: ABC transporter ATP-binding protein [Candidatus Hermodarchaeota archaeon]|jgi:ABC-2 type transport system ATP-binding protein|nr:ABC transporter ATP-binding protein [Candidatus Hermodarchaeota archaeon]
MNNNLAIKAEKLAKSFGPILALQNLNLDVTQGTRFGLLGPNGAGKTTTVRILSGLLKPTSGSALVCGLPLETKRNEIKAITGLLPETPGLYTKLSAVEFLEFIGALNGRNGETLNRRIDRLLALLGLESRQNDLLESYSSGMKQKVLVASTLLHDPKLVFLDEPTARLDPSASVIIKELIEILAEKTATTFFICTHQTSFAADVCDQIGIIIEGQLVAQGTLDELMEMTRTPNLEEAFLKIVGGKVDREALLDWR